MVEAIRRGCEALAPLANRLARFAASGALSFGLNLLLTTLMVEALGFEEGLAFGIALVTVTGVNFVVCRHFVFDAGAGCPKRQMGLFLATTVAFRGAEFVAFLIVENVLSVQYQLAIVAVLGTSFLAKFVLMRAWVFRVEPV